MRNKMEIGQRYRQNSTGSEVFCIAHDQSQCVVRYLNRYSKEQYFLRHGDVGTGKTEWTKQEPITTIQRNVMLSDDGSRVLNYQDMLTLCNVEYSFKKDKLIDVKLINN